MVSVLSFLAEIDGSINQPFVSIGIKKPGELSINAPTPIRVSAATDEIDAIRLKMKIACASLCWYIVALYQINLATI